LSERRVDGMQPVSRSDSDGILVDSWERGRGVKEVATFRGNETFTMTVECAAPALAAEASPAPLYGAP
jgi:hypothetical protein